ncbi:hypothetical protein GOP47_0016733 [Adiantum capillus-veneris]|uniref:Macro domain-containing protein n=1 Tax=Adiantum capillus-veneris TaxID=13818 RepID=A0A9D4UJ52_ADICA|nr:hypothetical protein GOP47_0016733 [Adiantum capillus-veneris]
MAASSSQAKPMPECRYGLLCQRKNTEHWLNFSHSSSVHFQADESKVQPESSCVCSEEKHLLNDDTVHPHFTVPGTGNSSRVLLMLVGLPGSGKSTFCNKLVQSNPSKWRRICQDTISNGKRGTKEQCLKAAEKALHQGVSVMIDRCNLTKDQRHGFVQLSRRVHAQAHALVLDLPVKTCIERAIQRTGHEGGLEGKSAPVAVQRMAQHKEKPLELEGFSFIVSCCTQEEVERAFKMYHNFNKMGSQADSRESNEKSISTVENQAKEQGINSNFGEYIDEGIRTLAFPSISTSDFQFDHERAADIIVEVAEDFLHKFRRLCLRLVLVDLKENSDMLVRVRQKARGHGLRSEEFMAIAGDITKLRSSCRLQCSFIANATNWRLKPGGGGVNAAIFKAAGEGLEIETKKRAKTLNPGSALVVPLPSTSPMYATEGVTHVIHVLGPNMNPERPNCLQGDYVEGSKLLRDAYSCMFRAFASHVESLSNKPMSKISVFDKRESPPNAFTVLMQSSKRKLGTADSDQKGKNSRWGTGQEEAEASMKYTLPMETANGSKFQDCNIPRSDGVLLPQNKPVIGMDQAQGCSFSSSSEPSKLKHWEPWADALRTMVLHPEQHKDTILQVTNEAIVISDKFPKGKKHFLVVSRLDGLDNIGELRHTHLSLLHDIHSLGMSFVQSSLQQDDSLVFRMGYHSHPLLSSTLYGCTG